MFDTERFNRDLKLDPSALDLAAATQAETFFFWAECAAKARTDLDRAKLSLELVESRCDIECRSTPEKYGLSRTTEASIKAAVRCAEPYVNAYEAYLRTKEECDLCNAAVSGMEQRKRMIEVLVTLHGQQYFAGPSVPRDLVSAWQDYQNKVSDTVTAKQAAKARTRSK